LINQTGTPELKTANRPPTARIRQIWRAK